MKVFDVLTNNFGDMSNFDRLFYKFINAYEPTYHIYEGTVPTNLTFNGDALQLCIIYGNMSQLGTPTPASPIYPSECGNLVGGDYILPVKTGVTTNINLGSTQTTRHIKKHTFTGSETVSNCVATTDGRNYCVVFRYDDIGMSDVIDYEKAMTDINYPQYVSSHFVNKTDNYDNYKTIYAGQVGANDYGSTGQARNRYIIFCVAGLTTAADYQAWFAQQYANGTPVELYYILEIETTGIINEPIRKIGDYVDSISFTDIPTTAGSQTFNIDTTTTPSGVYVIYY